MSEIEAIENLRYLQNLPMANDIYTCDICMCIVDESERSDCNIRKFCIGCHDMQRKCPCGYVQIGEFGMQTDILFFDDGVHCRQFFTCNGLVKEKWYRNGELHRDKLPAVIEYSGNKVIAEWFINDGKQTDYIRYLA